MEELGTSGENYGLGGCQLKGLGVFQGVGAGGTDIRVGDVGDDPPHGTVPGKLPTWGSQG